MAAAKEMCLPPILKPANPLMRFLNVLVGMSALKTANVPMTVMLTALAQHSKKIVLEHLSLKIF